MHTVRINFQKFVKERPVVDHCLTHFFRVGFPPLPSQRECASGAVILNDHRMIHRQVVRPPIEILERVAARGHDLRDELIGFAHGLVRVINKAPLNATPFAGKRIGLVLSELAQVETADALGALAQNSVSTCGADSLNGSFVLGSKAFAQVHAPTPTRISPGRKPEQQDNDTHTDEHEGFRIHGWPPEVRTCKRSSTLEQRRLAMKAGAAAGLLGR